MRDLVLLHVFLDYLHESGALSVPPGDLTAAAEAVAVRFSIAEQGGPGHDVLQETRARLEEMKRLYEPQKGIEANGT